VVRHQPAAKPFGKPAPKRAASKAGTLSIKPALLYLGFGGLLATNVLTLVGFLFAPDISRLLAGQNEAVYQAYEDRLAQMRLEVDRLQSRHYAQTGDINLQLQELSQTQEVLMEQQQYVKQLADKAAALGITDKAGTDAPDAGSDAAPPADPSQPSDDGQGTDGVSTDTAMLTGGVLPDIASGASGDPRARVAAAAATVNKMMDDSRLAMAALSDEASSKTDQIVGALAAIGIQPKLPATDDAEGGPLLPPIDGPDSSTLVDQANDVAAALDRLAAAKSAADTAPIHRPIVGATRISSLFGNRKDPFTGRLAFHPGIDFAAPQGTTVLSAGAGVVSFVGQISGYGNAIEITHPSGVISLYGHLSAFLTEQGDKVDTGTPIGRVGSTGRSTGPHLHFEVRRADASVNPAPYLSAGRVLAKLLPS
jgi:murein DD-endopeptidase MepM/ murein hydrolase activator NlpD